MHCVADTNEFISVDVSTMFLSREIHKIRQNSKVCFYEKNNMLVFAVASRRWAKMKRDLRPCIPFYF